MPDPKHAPSGPAKPVEADPPGWAEMLKRRKARHAAQNAQAAKDTKELAQHEARQREMQEKSTLNRGE